MAPGASPPQPQDSSPALTEPLPLSALAVGRGICAGGRDTLPTTPRGFPWTALGTGVVRFRLLDLISWPWPRPCHDHMCCYLCQNRLPRTGAGQPLSPTSHPRPWQGQKMEELSEASMTNKPSVQPGASPLPSPKLCPHLSNQDSIAGPSVVRIELLTKVEVSTVKWSTVWWPQP